MLQGDTFAHAGMMQWSPFNEQFAYLHRTMNNLNISDPHLQQVNFITKPLTEDQALHGLPMLEYGSHDLVLVSDYACNVTNAYRFWSSCSNPKNVVPIPMLPIENFGAQQSMLLSIYNEFGHLQRDRRFRM